MPQDSRPGGFLVMRGPPLGRGRFSSPPLGCSTVLLTDGRIAPAAEGAKCTALSL
jgi:hypothetical protein